MSNYVKNKRTWDDVALIVPDNWPQKKTNTASRYNLFPENNIQLESSFSYIHKHRPDILIISSDAFLTKGLRVIIEDANNPIVHIYNNNCSLNQKCIDKSDLIIFHASTMEDISRLYHILIYSTMKNKNRSVIIMADNDISCSLSKVIKNHNSVKTLDSDEPLYIIKQEILKRCKKIEEKNESDSFLANLTSRQRYILALFSIGLSISDIAKHAGISPATVYNLKARALKKVGAINKTLEAILYSYIRVEKHSVEDYI